MEQAEKYLAGYDRPVDATPVAHGQDPEPVAQLADNIRSRLNVRKSHTELDAVNSPTYRPGDWWAVIQKFDCLCPGNLRK